MRPRTNPSNNLRLQTELVLETTSEDLEPLVRIARCVWRVSDMIKHLSAGEEKDCNEG
jgi:hypothetical protein